MIIPVLAIFFVLLSIFLLLLSTSIALTVFIGGILVVIVFFHPYWGLLLYLAMTYLRPQEFIPALRAQPLMLILAGLILGTLIVHNSLSRKQFVALNLRQGIFMIIFFALIPISQLQRLYLTGAKDAFNSFLPVFLLFFMIINLITNFNQLKKAFYLLLFMTVFLAANGILQYYRGIDIAGQTMFQGRIRWIGIFEDPNDLGLTILAFTPFALLSMLQKGSSLVKRSLWLVVFLILLYALYLTNSRGTFIGLLVVIVFYLSKKWGPVKGLACGAVLALIMLIAGPSRFAEISTDEASASGRIDAWATGLNLLKWRPILGIGYGDFTEHHPLTAHNSVVLCMAELGLVGLFVWLLLFVSSFEEMQLAERKASGTGFAFYAQAMQLSLLGFFSAAFFLSRTYNEVCYIIIGLCTLLSLFARKEFGYSFLFLSRRTAVRTAIFALGLIVAIKILIMI
ncbi:MAG: O-antigen ligase family protein [Candidatus Krumholzibacteriota bacterium]|nr:O-antigen ligase family protein [Candidatus Krumholzibacteriota bacterium]